MEPEPKFSMRVFLIGGTVGAVVMLLLMAGAFDCVLDSDPCDRHPGYTEVASMWNGVKGCEGWEEYVDKHPYMDN